MSKEKKKTIIFTVSLAVVALLLIGVFIFMELRQTKVIGSLESNEIVSGFNEVYSSIKPTFFNSLTNCDIVLCPER